MRAGVLAGRRIAGAALLALALGACSSFEKPKPTPLETVESPRAVARVAWTAKFDKVAFPLALGAAGSTVAVASTDGAVTMLQADTGRELWRAEAGAPIVAGAGQDGTRVAVVTRASDVVVLENGAVRWRKPLPVRVSTAPLVAGERVFVLGVDRSIHAFDALDGTPIWIMARPSGGDALGLVHHGVLAPYKNTLLAGLGPRLAMVDSLRGSAGFDVAIATPRGTNEVERLADLVGPLARVNDVVCARAFQAAVGCANVDRGALVWSKTTTGSGAVGADATMVVGADAKSVVTAWKAGNGDTLWSHERVLHRELSGAALLLQAVAFGDGEGYVHFFDRATGATLQRVPTDGSAVIGTPVLVGKTLVVANRSGAVHGLAID